jgi:hypothetical protein
MIVHSNQNDRVSVNHNAPLVGKSIRSPPNHAFVTVMRFSVNVPVLSEQMSVALPIVSHAANTRIKLLSFNILRVEYAREMVTAKGRPSGMATTTTVMEVIRVWMIQF